MSAIRDAWYRWKALRLPWRKRFLVGHDLQGNTFWEFRETRGDGPGRFRRIAKYPRSTHHSDVKVSPQWHQWLRYTREHPPSVTEQSQDLVRQERMKILAAQADARWEAKPRVMDVPTGQQHSQPLPAPDTSKARPVAPGAVNVDETRKATPQAPLPEAGNPDNKKDGHDPWQRPRSGPSADWQPEAWTPPTSKRK